MGDWNTVNGVCCKPWLVLPAVYSDALSYGDQIAQFCSALNKVIQNNNNLPAYVQQMIQEYISGGVIGEIVQNVVSQFILNVKYPPEGLTPAVGDGSEDDTVAVQGCIDYASEHNGMAVYFPSGAYSVQSLTLKSEVSLFGFDRYSTKLVLRGGATTPMISLNGSNCGIYNLTLDGNAGVQVENINVVSMIAQDVYLDGLILQNGYQLLVYNGTGGHLQVNDVVFGNAVYRAVGISGNSVVQAKGLKFNQLSAVSGSDVINISSDGGTYDFISNVSCETCLSISGNDNYVTGIENGATNGFVDSGLRNTIDFKGGEKKEYYNGSTDTTVKGDVGFTTNGAYSENVSGAFTSVRNSTESKIVTGMSQEQYNSDKNLTVNGMSQEQYNSNKNLTVNGVYTETINNNKTTNINGNKTLTTEVYKESVNEKIINFKNTLFNTIYNDKKLNLYFANYNFVNVKDYGAVGNGVSDDSAAFNSAISTGYDIFIPEGTYLINGLNLADKRCKILCKGTILGGYTISNFSGEIIGGTWDTFQCAGCSSLTVRNAEFQSESSHGFYANDCSNLTLKNCIIHGKSNTVMIENSNFTTIQNCLVIMDDNTGGTLHALQINNCDLSTIDNVITENADWFGFSIYNSNYCKITNCISYNSKHEAINLENSNNGIVSNCIGFWSTTELSNDYGFSIFGNNENTANLNTISECFISNCAQSGIAVDGNAQLNLITNNIIANCNVKSSSRNYALCCCQLTGYTGKPANNTFSNNTIYKGEYTEGLFQDIEPNGTTYLLNNLLNVLSPVGSFTNAIFTGNYPVQNYTDITITSNVESAKLSDISCTYLSTDVVYLQATVTTTQGGALKLTTPFNCNGIGLILLSNADDFILGYANGYDIDFNNVQVGTNFVRAILKIVGVNF